MKRFALTLATVAIGGLTVVGCDRDETASTSTTSARTSPTSTAPAVDVDVDVNKDKLNNMADRTGDAIQRGAERTGEVAREAGRDTRDALQTAGRKIDNAVDRTRENVKVDVDADGAQPAGSRDTVAPNGTAAAPDAEGIRDVLAQVAEASLTKGGLDDLVERLVDQDRNRIGQTLQKDNADLDGRIDQFRKDWQAKYGQDFDIKNEEQAFPNNTFAIAQGEIGRAAAGADVKVDSPDAPAADANRNDAGRNIASLRVASQGMPALNVPMVHEAPDLWKIDVPNTLTAEKLKANVLAHLTAANEMKDQWPADVNQAYAAVTHHILMALMDQPVQQK
jgi:hypothetical protein